MPSRSRAALLFLGIVLGTLAPAAAAAPVAAAAPAAPGSALRTLVRLRATPAQADSSEELWSRLRGQTNDLAVVLVRVDDTGEATLSEQLAAAETLAAAHQARVVVWLRPLPSGPGLLVHVAEPAADRLFVREVPQREAGPAARSATLEAAALVVRSALRALAAGTAIGVPAQALAAAQSPPPPPPTHTWQLAAGAVGTWDGAPARGHLGAWTRLGWGTDTWRAHAQLDAHLPAEVADQRVRLTLNRFAAALGGSYSAAAGPLRAAATLDLGAVLFTRQSARLSDADTALETTAPARTAALLIRPGARLQVPLIPHRPRLAFELALAAEALLGAPRFVYQDAEGTQLAHTALWPVQASARAGLVLSF